MEMHSGCGGQIPVEEVVDRLDQLLERDLTGEAEDHLYSWLEKAWETGRESSPCRMSSWAFTEAAERKKKGFAP